MANDCDKCGIAYDEKKERQAGEGPRPDERNLAVEEEEVVVEYEGCMCHRLVTKGSDHLKRLTNL